VALSSNRYAVVSDLFVALDDDIGLYVRMLRTCHMVALAGDAPAAVMHGVGGGDDFAAVIGAVAESDKVNHDCCSVTGSLASRQI